MQVPMVATSEMRRMPMVRSDRVRGQVDRRQLRVSKAVIWERGYLEAEEALIFDCGPYAVRQPLSSEGAG